MSDLVERLRETYESVVTGTDVLRNPDGPEAAARIEQLEADLAEASKERSHQQGRADRNAREYANAQKVCAGAADEIDRLRAALRYYACKCKNPHTGCAVEFDRSGNARCGYDARAALGEKA